LSEDRWWQQTMDLQRLFLAHRKTTTLT